MIEIINENRISAEKIFKDLNQEEKAYLIEMISKEMPAVCLAAVECRIEGMKEELAGWRK